MANNGNSDIETIFNSAIELRNKGQLREATAILLTALVNFSADPGIFAVHIALGGIYKDLAEWESASENFRKATILKPESELASLGLYICYAELNTINKAIEELFRYLNNNPASLYKDTLKELVQGVEQGYMTDYEKEIKALAGKNGVY